MLLLMLYPTHSTDFGLRDQHPMQYISFPGSKTTPSQKCPIESSPFRLGKTFDKVRRDELIVALQQMGFSQHYCNIIQDCYKRPTFFVKDAFGSSQVKYQSSGIRQGCPLSPYLFVIVMSCVDFEIRSKNSRWVHNGRVPNLDFDLVYYADDTILFSTDNRALNELLKLTEAISCKYGLRLNKDECVAILRNNDGLVYFQNLEPLPKKFEATYSGNEINKEAKIRHEILNHMQEVRQTWFKLLPRWKATKMRT